MPIKQQLRTHLSEQVKRGLPDRALSEEELLAFLSKATFDGGRLPRYVESQGSAATGWVADLQESIEQAPETLLACLHDIARLERREKRTLASYLRVTFSLSAQAPMLQALLAAIEEIPETPTYQDIPRFLLPGW